MKPRSFILLLAIVCAAPAAAQEKPAAIYHTNKLYCDSDGDCAVREGLCGPEVMNLYYDNSELIKMQPLVKCAAVDPPLGPLKCVDHTCYDTSADNVRCPADAYVCPDGTSVVRVPPDCEFKKCPSSRYAEPPNRFESNMLHCRADDDCAIREGACGMEVMNIHYDNSRLIKMRPYVECGEAMVWELPRCEHRKCVADRAPQMQMPTSIESWQPKPVERLEGEIEAPPPGGPWECTAEAKLCPNGSAVGRTGPDCEFAKCPGEE